MKTLATIFLGASLFIGSSMFAVDAFYPQEGVDSPNYGQVMDFDNLPATAAGGMMDDVQYNTHNPLTEQGVSAFYPLEENDSPSYAKSHDTSDAILGLDSMSSTSRSVVIDTTFDAFYPLENDDSGIHK